MKFETTQYYAVYKYECGLKFLGLIFETEEDAWDYLNETKKIIRNGVEWAINREAYEIVPIQKISIKK